MIIAALYFAVLIGAGILLGLLWLAYKGLVYLWRQKFGTGEQNGRNEAKEAIKTITKGLTYLWTDDAKQTK